MNSTFPLRWSVLLGMAVLTLLTSACDRTTPVSADDDTSKYVDYSAAARHFPGLSSTQVQRELGSPNDVERTDSGRALWHYRNRFWETDARCAYKHVILTFENQKCVSIKPQ